MLAEIELPTGDGPPAYAHRTEDEVFYVLSGAMDLCIGETWHRLEAGDCGYVPRGVRHTFRNVLPEAVKFVSMHTPGTSEAMRDQFGMDLEAGARG
jgi:mannose-6-phosphate isomerase-like protein (cupin superfamily)